MTTRTLLLVPISPHRPRSILVSDGPLANIDPTASDPSNGRSQIRRFALGPAGMFAPLVPAGGFHWPSPGISLGDGDLLAFGIRNAAGLALSPNPTANPTDLWVVENGASLNAVIGDAASTNNPADELELVNLDNAGKGTVGKFYGFPYCHTGV